MSRDCYVALPRGGMGLSASCDCGVSCSYSLLLQSVASDPGLYYLSLSDKRTLG